jgi:hypothetical protein
MDYSVEDMMVRRPRRRLWAILAVVFPIIVLAGAAGWFVRAYVMSPTIGFERSANASTVATPAIESETTGRARPQASAPNAPAPTVRYSTDSAQVWASVPLPGPPRVAAQPAISTPEPMNGSVPLPPRRPRISTSTAEFDLPAVPLPRPRPSLAAN